MTASFRNLLIPLIVIGGLNTSLLAQPGTVKSHQKISLTEGNFNGILESTDLFGSSVAAIGDVDGDNVPDLAVGAQYDDDGSAIGSSNRGAVWILFMKNDNTVKSCQKISDTEGNFTGVLDDEDRFGFSIAALGDLDNDNVPDLAVGAYKDDDGSSGFDDDKGAVWILFLNSNGTVKAHQKISDTQGGFPANELNREDWFGYSVAAIGDLDIDGVIDMAVGAAKDDDCNCPHSAPNVGAMWILFMNTNGTVKTYKKISRTQGNFTHPTDTVRNNDKFGSAVAALGDLDNDGILDIVVGASQDDDGCTPNTGEYDKGAVWILFLNTDGTVKSFQKISDTAGGFTGTLDPDDEFGNSAALIGDLNGDAIPDLAIGAYMDDDDVWAGPKNYGAVWILFMNTNGTVQSFQKINKNQGNFTGTLNIGDNLGYSVAVLGDVNNDNIPDLAAGAPWDDDGESNAGAVWQLFLNGTVAGYADLIITDIDFNNINCLAGNYVGSVDVTVQNVGTLPAANFQVALTTDGCYSFVNQNVISLDANSSTTLTFGISSYWSDCTDCYCEFTATADVNSDVNEDEENNNQRTETFGSQRPDIVVNSVTPSVTCNGDGYISGTVTVNVSNDGCASLLGAEVYLSSTCGITFPLQAIFSVGKGSSRNLTFNFIPTTSNCNCTFTATVSVGLPLCECTDANNSKVSDPFTSNIPDIEIYDDNLSVSCAGDGQASVSGTVTLTNNGCGINLTANVPVRFTLYDNTGCSGNVIHQWTENLSSVNIASGGGNQTCTITTKNISSNLVLNSTGCRVSILIEADYNDSICEWDGTDNTYCADNKNVDIPDIEIQSDVLTVSCAGDGQYYVSGTVTLVNNGCGSNLNTNVPMRFTMFDNTGCAGNQVSQWTETFSSVNIASGGGTQVFALTTHNGTSNLCANSSNCQVSIRIEADYNSTICESDGTDNTYCADNKNVDIPDIEVQSETLNVSCANDGQFSVSGTVKLKNNGCGSNLSADVSMRFTVFDNTGCAGNQVSQWTETFTSVNIPSGGGTQAFTLATFNGTANLCINSTGCQVSIRIEADYTSTICESDGTDNTYCADNKTFSIPDLLVNSMTAQIESNGQGRVSVNVGNTGCGNAVGAVVRLTSDCGLAFSDQTVDLNGGQNKDLIFINTSGTATPKCNLFATIDPANNICECDGTNNTGTGSFSDQLDFGDAPDPLNADAGKYPTLFANNGARHVLNTNIYFGTKVDKDNDGQQNNKADGDDGDANGDDEDGIASDTLKLVEGTIPVIDIQVKNTSGQTVAIKGWIDYNGNGVFEAAESATNTTAVSGTKTLTFPQVPYGSTSNTFARFRVSSDAAAIANPIDIAPNGEVEDYYTIIDKDSDKDGVSDLTETTGDRDGDTITNDIDYDPTGYFYDEANGKILTGGKINVTGPGVITIIKDGSDGYYQFLTDGTAGIYTILATLPSGYDCSTSCTVTAGAVDPTGKPNPYILGNGEDGTTGYLTSNACTEFYLEFDLEPGDPFVFNNNFPLKNLQPINIELSSFYAEVGQDGVLIYWTTETEPNCAGFNIYRSNEENGDYIEINDSLIPAQGDATSGANYSYLDKPEQAGDYYYKLQSVSLDGNTVFYEPVFVALTSVEIKRYEIPENYTLSQNYPNPFNPETTIEFGLPKPGFVEISIYDINGKLVRTLVMEQRAAGNHIVKWNANDELGNRMTSGIYYYRMKVIDSDKGAGFQQTNRMILMK